MNKPYKTSSIGYLNYNQMKSITFVYRNAAKNILKEGLKIISSGTGDYTDGDGVRSSNTQLSTKSEAQPISFAVGG